MSVSMLVYRTIPSANMPENTTPRSASSLMRLFSFSQPVASAHAMPAANAPTANGSPAT